MDQNKIVYNWTTSIPDKWKKILGEDRFIHVSELKQSKSKLDLNKQKEHLGYKKNLKSTLSGQSNLLVVKSDKQKLSKKPNLVLGTSIHEDLSDKKTPILVDSKKSPQITLKKLKINIEATQKVKKNYLKEKNLKMPYVKRNNLNSIDFISFPKALQATTNRVFNTFSPRLNPQINF